MGRARIKKNDSVVVTAGANIGKTGKVLQILLDKDRVIVEGVSLRKKAMRKSQENPQGGIVEREGSIALSNLMHDCPNCKKGVRVGTSLEGDRKVRKCRTCGHSFDD